MPSRRSVLAALATSAAASALLPRLVLSQSQVPPASRQEDSPPDPLRPAFHYLPARNWMNDPCAPTFYRGQYHMFHQYNPHSAVWGDMHWAHATSPDMVHWQRQPVALAPTPGGPDSEGCFTGSSLRLPDGTPAIIYTGVQSVSPAEATLSDGTHNFRETQILATASSPGLDSWRKRAQPVIPSPPPGMHVTGFRDPSPFTHMGRQYLIVGSGVAREGGMALLFRSTAPDLTAWEYLHPLTRDPAWSNPSSTLDAPHHDPVDTGEMWECPDFFPLDGRHVLIYSTRRRTFWHVGDLDPKALTFHPTASGQLDLGRSFYAPKTQLDSHRSRILWGWLAESRPESEFAAAGWSGMLSLPRVLSIRDGQLSMQPLPALAQLRAPHPSGAIHEFTGTLRQGHTSATQPAQPFLLRDSSGPLLTIQSLAPGAAVPSAADALSLPAGTRLDDATPIHAFFDNSVLELFLGSSIVFTHRFYRRSAEAPVATLSLPGIFEVTGQQSFSLRPIWPA